MWRVVFQSDARRDVAKLKDAGLILEAIEAAEDLAYDPKPAGSIKMRGYKDLYRIRFAGGYRIVYRIDEKKKTITIRAVGPRGTIYQGMRD